MPEHDLDARSAATRRELLARAGALGVGALWASAGVARTLVDPADAAAGTNAASACFLSPEVTQGPYWIPNSLTRRDVREGRPGLPLILDLVVLRASSCRVIVGADVEIWHADAAGTYSGIGARTHYLRGHQRTNARGIAEFVTIYPGWYHGRAPHIHVKVHTGGSVVHTGQVFFATAVSDAVYRQVPYRARGEADTTNAADGIYADAGGSRALVRLARRRDGRGFRGTATLGVV